VVDILELACEPACGGLDDLRVTQQVEDGDAQTGRATSNNGRSRATPSISTR
jgi:hypothetical protein